MSSMYPEMEFLDLNLIYQSSSLFLMCYSQYWRILYKTICFSDFENLFQKNPRNQKNSWIAFCRTKKWGQITRQKLESEKTWVYAQKPRLNMLLKNSISEGTRCPEGGLANEDEWSPCCQICVPMVRIKAREGMVSTMQPFRMLINSYFYGSPTLNVHRSVLTPYNEPVSYILKKQPETNDDLSARLDFSGCF
jgi:hypothetical protein